MQIENIENQDLVNRLHKFGQSHVLQFWNELESVQKNKLIKQLESFDFELIEKLTGLAAIQSPWEKLAQNAEVPPAITLDQQTAGEAPYQRARATGSAALEAGKVGMILVAEGQGADSDSTNQKGCFLSAPSVNDLSTKYASSRYSAGVVNSVSGFLFM